ncbi:MAG: GerMN domain-containing protein [Acidimicrobiia bacterium]
MRRIVIAMTTLALVACGINPATEQPPQPGTATTLPTSSSTTPTIETTTTAAPVATTTTNGAPATTTTAQQATTTTRPVGPMVVAPYFYIDETGHPNRTGPFLFPMAREAAPTVGVARAAIEQLLAGPSSAEGESVPAISTAVPAGVRLLGLTVDAGLATIDLSSEFEAEDDSASVAARAAQVVFTLTRFDTVDRVSFREEGSPVSIQTGDGQLVSRPVDRDDYLDLAAALSVEGPVYRGIAGNPLRVTGFGAVFEASFQYALTDDDGLIIEEGLAMTSKGTGWGAFDFTVDYEVDRSQVGALILWTHSAENGAQIDLREYPVALTP